MRKPGRARPSRAHALHADEAPDRPTVLLTRDAALVGVGARF